MCYFCIKITNFLVKKWQTKTKVFLLSVFWQNYFPFRRKGVGVPPQRKIHWIVFCGLPKWALMNKIISDECGTDIQSIILNQQIIYINISLNSIDQSRPVGELVPRVQMLWPGSAYLRQAWELQQMEGSHNWSTLRPISCFQLRYQGCVCLLSPVYLLKGSCRNFSLQHSALPVQCGSHD